MLEFIFHYSTTKSLDNFLSVLVARRIFTGSAEFYPKSTRTATFTAEELPVVHSAFGGFPVALVFQWNHAIPGAIYR